MVYGYLRVSRDHQTVKNQKFEIEEFCKKHELSIDSWIDETISGMKEVKKRKLGRLIKLIQKDDLIICSELSRLGRNLFMIFNIISHCQEVGAKIWTIKDNFRMDDGIQSKVLAFAFGLAAEIERNLLSQRTKEALARVRAEGKNIGRQYGQKVAFKLDKHENEVIAMIRDGCNNAEISRKFDCCRKTVMIFKKRRLRMRCNF